MFSLRFYIIFPVPLPERIWNGCLFLFLLCLICESLPAFLRPVLLLHVEACHYKKQIGQTIDKAQNLFRNSILPIQGPEPPLCTAGFGLATGQIKFFVGAFYLFLINSVFIALATYLMVRFLKYEKNAFIDKVRERNVKRLMMVITLVTFIPSVVIGFHMVRVSLFEAVADKYVAQVFRFPHTRVIERNKHYAHGKDPSQIELLLVGEPIGDEIIENARAQMRNFGLEKAELVVRQANKTDEINVTSLQQSYLELLEEKNRRIGEMTAQLKRYRVTNVEVDDISREVGVMMENIKAISLMKGITFDVAGTPLDTTLVCVVTPKAPADSIDRTTLASWLRIRTKVDNVKLFVEP